MTQVNNKAEFQDSDSGRRSTFHEDKTEDRIFEDLDFTWTEGTLHMQVCGHEPYFRSVILLQIDDIAELKKFFDSVIEGYFPQKEE